MGQLMAYAYLVRETYGMPESGEISLCVVWLRFHEYEVVNVSSGQIDRWLEQYEEQKTRIGKVYHPNELCQYCVSRVGCQARQDWVSDAAGALVKMDPGAVSRETLASVYPKISAIKKALAAYDKALRASLSDGEPVQLEDGTSLQLEPVAKDKIDVMAAWETLEDSGLTPEQVNACLSIGKTKLLAEVGAEKPRGQKGKAKAQFMDRLRDAGAVRKVVSQQIKHTKIV